MKLLLALLIFSSGITPEEVVKLKKAGISDETIIKLIDVDQTVFQLTAEDIIALKAEGLSEKLLQHMVANSTSVAAPGGKGLIIENRSDRTVRVHVDSVRKTVEFDGSQGVRLESKTTREWEAPEGNYQVRKGGKAFAYRFDAPNRIILRGGKVGRMEIITAYIEKSGERDTFLVSLDEKEAPSVVYHRPTPTYPSYAWKPRYRYDDRTGNWVLMGAGIGAVVGHQSDHTWEGALIGGGAGLLLDQYLRRN